MDNVDACWGAIFCCCLIIITLSLGLSLSDFRQALFPTAPCDTIEIGEVFRESPNSYIALAFSACPDETSLEAFKEAASRWNEIITDNEIVPHTVGALGLDTRFSCGFLENNIFIESGYTFDHLLIVVDTHFIDGSKGVLAQAAPCLSDESEEYPVLGGMVFDSSDVGFLARNGNLHTVMMHEMGHVLGIGTNWAKTTPNRDALLEDPLYNSNGNIQVENIPKFIGENALTEYNDLRTGGDSDFVPVEDGRRNELFALFDPETNPSGGKGAVDVHWHQEVFGRELMVYSISADDSKYPISRITLASLQDLGYTVDMSAAEEYELRQPSKSTNLRGSESSHLEFDMNDIPAGYKGMKPITEFT